MLLYEKGVSHHCLEPDHPVQPSWYVFGVVVQYSLLSGLEPYLQYHVGVRLPATMNLQQTLPQRGTSAHGRNWHVRNQAKGIPLDKS